MKGFELKKILNRIKAEENTTITEIALKAGVDRGLLSTATNKGKDMAVTENTIEKLSDAYPKYFSTDSTNSIEKGHLKKTDSLLDREDRLIWAIASITKLSEEVVKLQSVIYGRDVVDCVAELDRSIKMLIQKLKDGAI